MPCFISADCCPIRLIISTFRTSIAYILEKDVVCIYAKKFLKSETAQYFVLTKHNEEKCKCQIVDCPLFEQCRPNEKIKAKTEQERFNNLSIAEKIDNTHYYPIMLNFDRVIERCSDNAFDIIVWYAVKKFVIHLCKPFKMLERLTFSNDSSIGPNFF